MVPWLTLSAMPGDVQVDDRVPRRLRGDGESKDVFALVKMQMSDTCLIQPPLSVWPSSFLRVTEDFWNKVNRTGHVVQQHLDEEREAELWKLQKAISKDYPHLQRAANYYKTLLDSSRLRQPYANLNFVDAGPSATDRIPYAELGEPAPPPKPHPLQVVFHQRRAWLTLGVPVGVRNWHVSAKKKVFCCLGWVSADEYGFSNESMMLNKR